MEAKSQLVFMKELQRISPTLPACRYLKLKKLAQISGISLNQMAARILALYADNPASFEAIAGRSIENKLKSCQEHSLEL